jgi:hypothetical protein
MVVDAATKVVTQLHEVDGREICRVHVDPSGRPAVSLVWRRAEAFLKMNTPLPLRVSGPVNCAEELNE